MSYYYKQSFISSSGVFATIKEELKSYFDSGIVDDVMFPLWTDKCLNKLGRGTFPINSTILYVVNSEFRLPDDFYAVREAWLCTSFDQSYQLPNASYQQVDTCSSSTAMLLNSGVVACEACTDCESPEVMRAIYKVTNTVLFSFKRQFMLTPG